MDALNVTTTLGAFTGSAAGAWGGTVLYLTLFVFIPLGFLGILCAILWNLASYTRFKKYLVMFGNSFRYALLGLLTLGALSIPMGLVYWGYSQARAGNTVPFRYTFYAIGAFIILALIGKAVDKFVIKRVNDFENKIGRTK